MLYYSIALLPTAPRQLPLSLGDVFESLDVDDDGVMWPGGCRLRLALAPSRLFPPPKKVEVSLSLPPALLPSESVVSYDH